MKNIRKALLLSAFGTTLFSVELYAQTSNTPTGQNAQAVPTDPTLRPQPINPPSGRQNDVTIPPSTTPSDTVQGTTKAGRDCPAGFTRSGKATSDECVPVSDSVPSATDRNIDPSTGAARPMP
jgi:hypothetical protein